MRIIGGRYRGHRLQVPAGLPVRPTTDFAKEGLFNILNNIVDYDGAVVLDLFTGTGHIALEFASRGSGNVTAVDKNTKCVSFVRSVASRLGLHITTVKEDVFAFLDRSTQQYDVIFADPPYDLDDIPGIHRRVFGRALLRPGGLLVIEHGPGTDLQQLENFMRHRKYGNVNFSFFRMPDRAG